MGNTQGFEKAIFITKCSVYLAFGWPPSRSATKWEIIKYDMMWFVSIVSTLCILAPLVSSIYFYRHDSIVVANSVALASALTSLILKMILLRVRRKQTQILIEEMESFLKMLRPFEEIILQRNVDKFLLFQTSISVMSYMAVCLLIAGPLILPDQRFPIDAICYPFNVDSGIVMYLIYLQQSICNLQSAASIGIDGQAALFMWFAGARLEILAQELADIADVNGLQYFVRKHNKSMSYAVRASEMMRYTVLVSATNIAISAIMSAMQLISDQPLAQKLPFGLATVICTLILFVSASPADNLIQMCDLLGNAVYNTSWIDMSTAMRKNLLIVLRRCQRPILVSVAGFIPALSLNFYGSFLSGLASYFAALRVVMSSEN